VTGGEVVDGPGAPAGLRGQAPPGDRLARGEQDEIPVSRQPLRPGTGSGTSSMPASLHGLC